MSDATTELRGALRQLARAVEWQAELGAHGVPAAPSEPRQEAGGESTPRDGATERQVESAREPVVATEVASESAPPALTLDGIREELGDCERCKLCSGRQHIVFGVGNPKADLMFVGEAPGADEDRQGVPFVGRAGQLLTRMIGAMGLTRDDVYIANIIKCRPPGNRDPEPAEVMACEPFLLKQIDAIEPKVIVSLGRVSAQTLLRARTSITRIRGRWRDYHGVKLMPTFHPAYLLRSPDKKREVWDDLQAVMRELDLELPTRG